MSSSNNDRDLLPFKNLVSKMPANQRERAKVFIREFMTQLTSDPQALVTILSQPTVDEPAIISLVDWVGRDIQLPPPTTTTTASRPSKKIKRISGKLSVKSGGQQVVKQPTKAAAAHQVHHHNSSSSSSDDDDDEEEDDSSSSSGSSPVPVRRSSVLSSPPKGSSKVVKAKVPLPRKPATKKTKAFNLSVSGSSGEESPEPTKMHKKVAMKKKEGMKKKQPSTTESSDEELAPVDPAVFLRANQLYKEQQAKRLRAAVIRNMETTRVRELTPPPKVKKNNPVRPPKGSTIPPKGKKRDAKPPKSTSPTAAAVTTTVMTSKRDKKKKTPEFVCTLFKKGPVQIFMTLTDLRKHTE